MHGSFAIPGRQSHTVPEELAALVADEAPAPSGGKAAAAATDTRTTAPASARGTPARPPRRPGSTTAPCARVRLFDRSLHAMIGHVYQSLLGR